MFYRTTLQFHKAGSLRLMIMVLVVKAFAFIYSHAAEYSFDLDDSKKEFYERENKNINVVEKDKATVISQGYSKFDELDKILSFSKLKK